MQYGDLTCICSWTKEVDDMSVGIQAGVQGHLPYQAHGAARAMHSRSYVRHSTFVWQKVLWADGTLP